MMPNMSEWRILGLWALAVGTSALLTDNQSIFQLGGVFFICMLGSLTAIRQASRRHVEWVMVALWAITTLAMLVITGDSSIGNVLGPLYFVCMIGSVFTAREAYQAMA